MGEGYDLSLHGRVDDLVAFVFLESIDVALLVFGAIEFENVAQDATAFLVIEELADRQPVRGLDLFAESGNSDEDGRECGTDRTDDECDSGEKGSEDRGVDPGHSATGPQPR